MRSPIPCVGKLYVTIAVFSGVFFIAKLYALKMAMRLFGRGFSVVHNWRNTDNFHTFKQDTEIFRFLSYIVDRVPLNSADVSV